MSINSLSWSFWADDVSKKWLCQATIWEKLSKRPRSNKRPSSSPKFEISARALIQRFMVYLFQSETTITPRMVNANAIVTSNFAQIAKATC